MDVITVASLNVHGVKDGWWRRGPVVVEALREMDADVVVLQEAARWVPQPWWIARELSRGGGRQYRAVTASKLGWWWFVEGLAVVTRLRVLESARLDLGGDARVAQRVTLVGASGVVFDVYNVHLAHRGEHEGLREAQVGRLLAWAGRRPGVPAIVAGDFNADPGSGAVRAMLGEGEWGRGGLEGGAEARGHGGTATPVFRSAHAVVHGAESASTAPSSAASGRGRMLDYVFVGEGVRVVGCEVGFGAVERRGRVVWPSDHLGLVVRVEVG